MAQLKNLAKQTALYGISSIAARLLTFVFLTPYLTRKFMDEAGMAEMGIQTDIYAWAAFLIIPFTYRMETALFRFGSNKADIGRTFRTAAISIIFSTVVLVVFLLVFAQQIANLMEYPHLPHYIVWIVLIIGLDALSAIPFALLRLQGRAMRFAGIKIFHMFLYLGLLVFMMELGPYFQANHLLLADYWYYDLGIGHVFVANLLANFVMFLMLLPSYFEFFIRPRTRPITVSEGDAPLVEKPEPYFDKILWRKMMIYSMPLVLASFAGMINDVLDRTLLKVLLPGELNDRLVLVGIYGACYKISIFMHLFTQAFNYAAEPFFFKNADNKESKPLYAGVSLVFTVIGCIAFLGIMLFMDIVQFFVAAPYREGIAIVPILLIANLFLGLYYNVAAWYKLADKTRYGAYIAIIGAVITILGNILLIPRIGYIGAAWATLACYVVMVVICYLWGQKYYPIPYPVFKILAYIGSALAVYGLYCLIYPFVQPFTIPAFGLSFLFLLVYIGGLWKLEGKYLMQVIRR